MKKKHIALVNLNCFDPFLRDGASSSILSRLQFIQKQNKTASILTFLTNEPHLHFLFGESLADSTGKVVKDGDKCSAIYAGLDFQQQILPYSWRELPKNRGVARKTIMRKIQQEAMDFVFTLDQDHFSLFAAWFLKIPGAHFFNSLANVRNFSRVWGSPRFIKERLIFTNSRFLQAWIKDLLGLESTVWYPHIDFAAYKGRRKQLQVRCIGFVASSAWMAKGGEIVREISRRMPECRFLAVGLSDRCPSLGLPENMTCWKHTLNMKSFYERIDLLLVPSLIEDSFPRVVLEAAANGIPVLANRIGGISEALGDSGILIDWKTTNEPDFDEIGGSYVSEIRRILGDENLFRHYTEMALARAEEYHRDQERLALQIYKKHIS